MAVLPTTKHGNPVLTGRVEPIEGVTDEILTLVDDMIDTMRNGETPGVGLAAPQIGRSLSIIVAEPPPDYEGTEAVHNGAVVLMNPEIVYSKGHTIIEEGCLSCPGVTAEVGRPSHVVIKGLDRDGNAVKLEVEGALARIFQHEVDHLHGKFFFDHLNPIKRQLVKARIRRT
jgi:peptide deformylase